MDAMFARRTIFIVSSGILVLGAGCNSGSGPAYSQAPPATMPTTAPAANLAPDDGAQAALAAKVAQFTKDLQPVMDHAAVRRERASMHLAGAMTQPADLEAVDTRFLSPDSIRLTPFMQEKDIPAAAPPASPPMATGDANSPLNVPDNSDRQANAINASESLSPGSDVERKLIQHVRDYPKDLEGQLDYELLLYIEGQPVPQMSTASGLREEDREILAAIMDGLSNFRSVIRSDDNLMLEKKARPLMDMADRLRSQAELTLPTVALCNHVQCFGVFTPFDSNRFIAGRDNQVIVYCEVQGFESQPTADNQWETKLTQEMVLYTDTGLPVWPAKSQPEEVIDLCREKRHDFFIAKLVTLPTNLTIGRYVLKLTVTDEQANHVAESTTPLEIVAE
jgi:hypothetical protein